MRFYVLCLLTLVSVFFTTTICQAVPAVCITAQQEEEPAKKIEMFDECLTDEELPPDFAALIHGYRGFAYGQQGNYGKAIEDYNMAIELDPKDAYSLNNRGIAYLQTGEYAQGMEDFQLILEFEVLPEDKLLADVHGNLGDALFYSKNFEQAVESYTNSIELDSERAQAFNNRASSYMELGKFEEALEDYNKGIDLDEDNSMFYLNRAAAYLDLEEFDKARDDYRQARELDPENGDIDGYLLRVEDLIKQAEEQKDNE